VNMNHRKVLLCFDNTIDNDPFFDQRL
jgi:hypothetical protein